MPRSIDPFAPSSHVRGLPVLLGFLAALAGCRPELPRGEGSGGGATTGLRVEAVPDADLDALPAAFWLRVTAPGGTPLELDALHLVRGSVGPRSVEQLASGRPSEGLEARIVAAQTFRDGDATVLAPMAWLEPGERLSLVIGPLEEVVPISVSPTPVEALVRVFPDEGVAARQVALCGDAPLPGATRQLALAPESVPARLTIGAPGGGARRCAFVEVIAGEGTAFLPPAVDLEGARFALDPAPLWLDGVVTTPPEALPCDADEVRFGPGCARVDDDRLTLRAPDSPLFWGLAAASIDLGFATRPGQRVEVRGLLPDAEQDVRVALLDPSGRWTTQRVRVRTGPPRAHFVLNEVYADALGPEPEQEWIEVVNDGAVGGSLAGHVLVDVGGLTPLPDVQVAPGEHVLLVNEAYDPSGAWDVPPAPGTRLVRVPALGKGGLSNQGEALWIEDASGRVVTRFPATPKPKPGVSVARRSPGADDADPTAFARAEPGPTPGAPNGEPAEGG